jgi:hypothetical protein
MGVGPPVKNGIAEEQLSHAFGRRSTLGWEPAPEGIDQKQKPPRLIADENAA